MFFFSIHADKRLRHGYSFAHSTRVSLCVEIYCMTLLKNNSNGLSVPDYTFTINEGSARARSMDVGRKGVHVCIQKDPCVYTNLYTEEKNVYEGVSRYLRNIRIFAFDVASAHVGEKSAVVGIISHDH